MLSRMVVAMCALSWCTGDVSHLSPDPLPEQFHYEPSTEPPPAKPYVFSYTAGRFPGHADRTHTEVSDGSGVIRGTFSYVDPRQKVRTVDYVADKQGFHPVLSEQPPAHPRDSAVVARAKDSHQRLYDEIAHQHASHPHPDSESSVPRQSAAVQAAAARHAQLFRVIAEQHARIAAERELLQQEDEQNTQDSLQDITHH